MFKPLKRWNREDYVNDFETLVELNTENWRCRSSDIQKFGRALKTYSLHNVKDSSEDGRFLETAEATFV